MFCRKCGNELDEKDKLCSRCGNKVNRISIHISKTGGIIGVIICVIIGLVSGILLLQNSVYSVIKYIDDNNFDEAVKIYSEKIQGDKSKEEKFEDSVEEKLKVIQKKFINKEITYDECKQVFDTIEKIDIEIADLKSIKTDIMQLNDSRKSYEKAQELINNTSYLEAIKELEKIIEEDQNYENAQQSILDISQKYQENVIAEVDDKIANNQYEDADKILDEALSVLSDSEELKKRKSSIAEKIKEIKEQRREQEIEEVRKNQLLTVKSAKIVSQSSQWKSLYPDMIQVIIYNNSEETVKSMVVGSIAFDANGLPIKIQGQYNFGNVDYEFLGNAEDVNILPDRTFGDGVGWSLDESHGITYVLSCVKEATFYNGETWSNPYYSYWKEKYIEKELPQDLR